MPHVTIFRASEEIVEISDLRVDGEARIRLTDGEWGWCPVADLIRVGLLPAPEPAPEAGAARAGAVPLLRRVL